MILLARAIAYLGNILSTCLLIRALLSWVINMTRNDLARNVYGVLYRFTEPIVAPCRNFMAKHFNTGPLDFSIFVAMILVELVTRILVRFLLILA